MRGVAKGVFAKVKDAEIYGFKDGYKGLIYSSFDMMTERDFFRYFDKRWDDTRDVQTAV